MSLRVAVAQLAATDDGAAGTEAAAELVARAAETGARLVLLPEYALAWAPRLHTGLAAEHARFARGLASAAASHGVWVIAGTLVPDGDRMRNVALAVGPDG
ncbi:MAG TPA: nitrilase-related carbon-nitrogen hydrolase, partial [Actinomycetota bacterium]|nr:nitrilase-related carbon-nitrogen hydrolase [Actinomycetota bacterium]